MRNNNLENTISKAKFQSFYLSTDFPPEKPKKKPQRNFTREEQYEHGPERKKSFNRRWKSSKKEREELEAIHPGRNLFTFNASWYVTTSNESLARNKNYIFKPNLPSLVSFLSTKVGQASKVSRKSRKRIVMRALPSLKYIELLEHGQAKFSVYPDEALIYADEQMKHARTNEPLKLFCYWAKLYCQKNQIKPNWKLWFDYKEQHQLAEDLPFLKLKPKELPKREMSELDRSTQQKLNDIVSRKASAFFKDRTKSQFYVMRKLETFAQFYPQAEKEWKAWTKTLQGIEFLAWIRFYTLKYPSYADWDPFAFDYKKHRDIVGSIFS